jgi:hypothetical protein
MSKFTLDLKLREYATDLQWEKLEAWAKQGTTRAAGKALGCSICLFTKALKAVLKKAGQHGYAPDRDLVHRAAPGMTSRGTSILYNSRGEVVGYWNKTRQEGRSPDEVVSLPDPKTIVKLSTYYDQEGRVTGQWVAEKPDAVAQAAAWAEYAKALTEDLPRVEPTSPPEMADDDLMACYPVSDHHMGMLAWPAETGAPWDIAIAERVLASAIDYLVATAPPASQALVPFLGDYMHYDSHLAETPTAHNRLDPDSRFGKMVEAVFRSMRRTIECALEKHGQVHVIVEIGNHDLSSSVFLMAALANIYENEPRVTIDTSPMQVHYYRFGDCLVGTHHGHRIKMKELPIIMATDCKEDWGATTHRYWWTGHIHHAKTQAAMHAHDFSGCTVESFQVLGPEDAWAREQGYRATRSMKSIILHRRYGEVARNTVNPDMFQEVTK